MAATMAQLLDAYSELERNGDVPNGTLDAIKAAYQHGANAALNAMERQPIANDVYGIGLASAINNVREAFDL